MYASSSVTLREMPHRQCTSTPVPSLRAAAMNATTPGSRASSDWSASRACTSRMGTRRYLHRCGKASGVVVVAFTTWEICARGPVLGASGGNRQQRELERELVLELVLVVVEVVLELALVLERTKGKAQHLTVSQRFFVQRSLVSRQVHRRKALGSVRLQYQ
jgi:cbb3-type cytochrome oxidase subunit 1